MFGASTVCGVGHPEQPLSDVRGADARSAQIGGPDRIAHGFQVSAYSSEPLAPSRACNLFAKDDWRRTVQDEATERRPEMARIRSAHLLTDGAEWLAGAGTGPYRFIVWPAGETQGEAPSANPGEEMALGELNKVSCPDGADVACIDFPGGNVAGADEFAEPLGCFWIVLIVVVHAFAFCSHVQTSNPGAPRP